MFLAKKGLTFTCFTDIFKLVLNMRLMFENTGANGLDSGMWSDGCMPRCHNLVKSGKSLIGTSQVAFAA